MKTASVALLMMLAGCSSGTPDVADGNNSTDAAGANLATAPDATLARPVDYSGRWTGVEGMYLDIKDAGSPGRYNLTMQWDLDNKGVFEGTAKGDTIVFDRKGVRQTLRPTDGAATGLKYLADKKICLTVGPGEGYCRG